MTRLKSMLLVLVLSTVVMLIIYGSLDLDVHGHYASSQDVVLVYTEYDVCQKWSAAFPLHAVILVGYSQSVRSDGACHYATLRNGSLNHLAMAARFQPHEVHLVQGDQDPNSCSRPTGSIEWTVSSTGVLYQNSKDPIFNTRQHWGYGGNDHLEETAQYYSCDSLWPPVMTVTAAMYARPPCGNVLPSMVLGKGVYTRTPGRCLALTRSVLWALPLYFSTTKDSTYEGITLSMIAQRLMWGNGDSLEQRMAYVSNQQSEDNSHMIMSEVAKQLDLLKCEVSMGLKPCLLMLMHKFTELGYISENKLLEVSQWASTRLSNAFNTLQSNDDVEAQLESCTEHKSYISQRDSSVRVLERYPAQGDVGCVLAINSEAREDVMANTCKALSGISKPWLQWSNTLLIVTFTNPTYVSIPLYETLYRPFFPHIVYCAATYPNKTELSLLKRFAFTFVKIASNPAGMDHDSTNYDCLIKASRLGYDVTGYLQVADDVLLMPHRLQHMDLTKVWTWRLNNILKVNYMESKACAKDECWVDADTYWKNFNTSTLGALAEIQELAGDSVSASDCQSNIEELYGGQNWSLRIPSDIFYIPTEYIDDVTEILGVFHQHHTHRDIAVPTVLHCILSNEIDPLYTSSHNSLAPNKIIPYSPMVRDPHRPNLTMTHRLYEGGEDPPWNQMAGRLLNGIAFVHPHHLGHVTSGNETHVQFFCNLFQFFNDPNPGTSRAFKL